MHKIQMPKVSLHRPHFTKKSLLKTAKISGIILVGLTTILYIFWLIYFAGIFASGKRYSIDIPGSQLPKFVHANIMDLKNVVEISKFRSGAGHSYTGTYESCRSNKHYFITTNQYGQKKTTPLYSPVNGEVVFFMPDMQDGEQIYLRPDGYPQFTVTLFHTHLFSGIHLFSHVTAGQRIATNLSNGSDVAVQQYKWNSLRMRSIFDVMDNKTFATYTKYHITSRDQMKFSRTYRDSHPLSCRGQSFTDNQRNNADYVEINPGYVLGPNGAPYPQNQQPAQRAQSQNGTPAPYPMNSQIQVAPQ